VGRVIQDTYYNKKHVRKSIFWIVGIILLGSVMVYGLNSQLSRSFYFFIVLAYLLLSKDKVLTAAIFFVLLLYPIQLFYSSPYNWAIPITSSVGIRYYSVFIIGYAFKYLVSVKFKTELIKDHFKPYYKVFVLYFLLLILIGFLFGYNKTAYYNLFRSVVVLSLFIVFTRIMNEKQMLQFNRIIFAFTIILAIVGIVEILLKGAILETLVFGRTTRRHLISEEGIMRVGVGGRLMFYSIIIATYYLISGKGQFRKDYLWFIIVLSYVTIFNTASRGWIIASSFVIVISVLYYIKNIILKPRVFIIGLAIIFVVTIFLPETIKQNLVYAYERVETLEEVAAGDMTGGGTIGRWTERGPRALTRFDESPIFGFGFSKVSAEYYDHHVGNHSLLITSGILGLSIIWLTVISIVYYIFKLESKSKYFKSFFVFGIAIMALMLIHSSNEITISFFGTPVDAAILWVIIFNNINASIDSVIKCKYELPKLSHIGQ